MKVRIHPSWYVTVVVVALAAALAPSAVHFISPTIPDDSSLEGLVVRGRSLGWGCHFPYKDADGEGVLFLEDPNASPKAGVSQPGALYVVARGAAGDGPRFVTTGPARMVRRLISSP